MKESDSKSCCHQEPIEPKTESSCCGQKSLPEPEIDSGCCSQPQHPVEEATSSCCGTQTANPAVEGSQFRVTPSCCETESAEGQRSIDWLLWVSLTLVVIGYGIHAIQVDVPSWMQPISHGIFELMNTMWWGLVLGIVFVGILGRIPQSMVTAVLGQGGTLRGVLRATMAGVMLDLCSHGILMVGMQLYQRGASLGQVMAFLIASPWNSLSLTIILVALIGLPLTLLFVVLSMAIAIASGCIFERLVARNVLPENPNQIQLPEHYRLWPEFKQLLSRADISPKGIGRMLFDGLKGSRMVLRWLLFGVLLATALRSLLTLEDFQQWFGPTLLGLGATLIMATIIEVCSEGSTPISADLVTRGQSPGNGFAFLMTGVATDYTEIMVLKDVTRSWKIALFLPLVCVPQVVVIALVLNFI